LLARDVQFDGKLAEHNLCALQSFLTTREHPFVFILMKMLLITQQQQLVHCEFIFSSLRS